MPAPGGKRTPWAAPERARSLAAAGRRQADAGACRSAETPAFGRAYRQDRARGAAARHGQARPRCSSRPRSAPRAPLRGPGSRSRRRARATRRWPGTSRESAARARGSARASRRRPRARCRRPRAARSRSSPRGCGRTARAGSARPRAASRGLPKMRPSSTTAVSAPRRGRRCDRARALRSAFSATTSRGIALGQLLHLRRLDAKVDPELLEDRPPLRRARGQDSRGHSSGKNSPISRCGGLGRVGAVDQVGLDLEAEVAADRAGRRLDRVGRADHLPRGRDRLVALEHQRDQRAAGDEVDEVAEERACSLCSA